jgi:TP901 family phage tail tape measure protein
MADRRVKVIFGAEIQGFKSAMAEAAAATEKVKKSSEDSSKAADTHLGKLVQSATNNRDAWEQTGAVVAGAGALMVGGVGLAVKSFADFDKQMSSVKAATHETAGNMDLLREAAISAGADTAFSAQEAAQGIEELAKAGVSTKDILGGGLKGSLDLAAAGALSVGEAAEIAASALTQFGLSGDKVPHIADLLAAGAGKAQGSVHDMGEALNQVGLVADQTGLSIEETTGGLAAFASAGLTGSDAGTSFKTMLAAITPNSKEAAKAMKELGISAFDANGEFIGLSEYAGVLQEAMSGLTDEQRISTMETIFGSDAVRAASVLYDQGAEGIQKWENAVNDAGYAAETAATMQDNLAGDIEKLGGSMDSVFLKSGSGANDFLRGLAQGAEDAVDAIGNIPGPVLSTGAAIAGVVGIAALGAGAFLNLTPKVLDAVQAFDKLAPAGSKARTALEGVGKGAGAAMALGSVAVIAGKLAEADYMDDIDTGMGKVAKALARVAADSPDAAAGLDSLFQDRDGGDLINTVTDLESAINRTFNKDAGQAFNDWGEGLVSTFTPLKGSTHMLAESFDRLDTGLAEMVSSGNAEGAAKNFEQIKTAAENQGVSIEDLKKKFPEYADALKDAEASQITAAAGGDKVKASLDGAGTAAEDAAVKAEEVQKALEDVGLAADGSVSDIEAFTTALFNAGLLSLSSSNAAIAYQAAIDAVTDSITKNGTTLDINTEQGRANQSAFNGLASAAMAAATATATETLATQGSDAALQSLQGALRGSYDDLVRAAGQFGITGDEADTLARKALGIPKETPIDSWVNDQASAKLDAIKGRADALDGKQVTTTVTTIEHTIRRIETQVLGGGSADDPSMTALDPRGRATGGRLPGFAFGGQLPMTGPGTDRRDGFLGISSAGVPLARVDAGEWIINRGSSDRYNRELSAINAGTFPKLPGYANGGREYSAQQLGYYGGSAAAGVVQNTTYQIDAKPGLAYEYAKDIARQAETRRRDLDKAFGN